MSEFIETETFRVGDTGAEAKRTLLPPVLLLPFVAFLLLWFILNRLVLAAFGMGEGAPRLLLSALVALVVMGLVILAWLKL